MRGYSPVFAAGEKNALPLVYLPRLEARNRNTFTTKVKCRRPQAEVPDEVNV